jgi:hypothetical protein
MEVETNEHGIEIPGIGELTQPKLILDETWGSHKQTWESNQEKRVVNCLIVFTTRCAVFRLLLIYH